MVFPSAADRDLCADVVGSLVRAGLFRNRAAGVDQWGSFKGVTLDPTHADVIAAKVRVLQTLSI